MFVHRLGGAPAAVVSVHWDDDIWPVDEVEASYIHLLMVDRRFAGEGLGAEMLKWAERHILEDGRTFARLDAVRSNQALQQWYAQRGYRLVGFRDFSSCQYETALREKRLDVDAR